jgi:peptide/nickel transport system substrate-binding protein
MHGFGKTVGTILLAATIAATPGFALADKADDTVVIAFAREVTGLDYNQEVPTEYIMVGDLIDDSLFYVEPEGLTYAPSLALDSTLVDDLTVDVNLRQDAKFHDGSLMTADDVVYTFNYIKDDTENARHAKISDWLASIEKTGEFSVRFNLSYPYANFYNDLYRVKIRKEGIMGEPGAYDSSAQITTNNGLGPYKVKSFEPGVELVLERNEDYFDGPKGKPAIKNMVIRSIPDEGTQQAELMSGGIHWMYNVGRDVGEAVARSGQAQFTLGPSLRVGFLVLDAGGYTGKDNPVTKLEVRRAMNHAINRPQIAEILVGGSAEAIDTACNPVVFGCTQDVMKYEYDPEKAKALLAEAGYPNGFDLELWSYRDKDIAEAIAADLGKVGINVQLRHVKLASLNQARADRQIRAYFGTWGSTASPDTATIANIHWRDPNDGDRNLSGDPRTTELMIGAEQTLDPEKRKALYKEGLQLIAEQAYWVPLHTYSEGVLLSNDINFVADKDGYPRLWNMTWK